MSPTIEVESALGILSRIKEIAEGKGWERKRALPYTIHFPIDSESADVLIFEKGGKEEVVTAVRREGKKDLVSAPEKFLKELR